mgnify:CR=1 FL=1
MEYKIDHIIKPLLSDSTLYFTAPLDCTVYLEPPDGFKVKDNDNEGSTLIWQLNKSLYGLKQSGHNWNLVLNEFFRDNGFKNSNVDACLFTKINKDEKTFVVIWVDDIIITTTSDEEMNRTKNSLKEKFKMKNSKNI